MGVVREVPDFVNAEQRRTAVGAQPSVQAAHAVSWAVRSRMRSDAVMKRAECPASTAS
jgi:hypothetical protein